MGRGLTDRAVLFTIRNQRDVLFDHVLSVLNGRVETAFGQNRLGPKLRF